VLATVSLLGVVACGSDNNNNPAGPSSLVTDDVTVGTGAAAANGDTVTVNYTGTFLDGRVFDSSVGKAPLTFRIGAAQLIPGFEQGVVGMRVGGRRRVTIPPELAYGSAGRDPIPPNTTIRFEIDLLSIAGR
jgi:peptidylprolyl isomerase/FKBP-type peptidyl-prolyl cis-trans isomerase FkpA